MSSVTFVTEWFWDCCYFCGINDKEHGFWKFEKLKDIEIMGLLSIFGIGGKSENIKEFLDKGAVIIDVRTTGEYKEGHIKGSKNIPLDTIFSKAAEIKKLNKPIIVCCRSGMRSGQAAAILKNSGIEVMNGGSWQSLANKL